MAVITTGSHPAALWPGIRAWWGRKYSEHPVEYTQLFDMMDSSQNYEEMVQLTGFGLAPSKSEGSSVSYVEESQGYTTRFTHLAYALITSATASKGADANSLNCGELREDNPQRSRETGTFNDHLETEYCSSEWEAGSILRDDDMVCSNRELLAA